MDESKPGVQDRLFLSRLRRLGFAEGVSTLVLFGIAMPLKYLADMPMAMRIVGSLHGFLPVHHAADGGFAGAYLSRSRVCGCRRRDCPLRTVLVRPATAELTTSRKKAEHRSVWLCQMLVPLAKK